MRIPIVAACCAALRAAFGGGIVCLVALTALAQPVPPISSGDQGLARCQALLTPSPVASPGFPSLAHV